MANPDDHSELTKYWEMYQIGSEDVQDDSPTDSPIDMKLDRQVGGATNGYRSSRAISSTPVSHTNDQHLSAHHPALSLPTMLQLFGPLVFPLYRAALLRKRILFLSEAPVELACNFGKMPESHL